MKIVFKVLFGLIGLLIGEMILGYILSLAQVVEVIVKVQTFNELLMAIPFRLVIIITSTVVVGFFIIRMVLNERKIVQELQDTLYETLETLENYKRINEQYPSQVSDEDMERIRLKIKKIHHEIKNREIHVQVNDSDVSKN